MRLDETRARSGNPAILQGQQPRGPEALRPRLATSLPLLTRLTIDAGYDARSASGILNRSLSSIRDNSDKNIALVNGRRAAKTTVEFLRQRAP